MSDMNNQETHQALLKVEPKQVQKRITRRIFLILLPLLVIFISAFIYLRGGRYIETDNAYVQSNMTTITAQVSGSINKVPVKENAKVKKGQLLFTIDDASYKVAQAKAEAQLQQVKLNILEQKAAYDEKQSEIKLAENTYSFDLREEKRQSNLLKKKFISDAQFDRARQTARVSQLNITALKKDLLRLKAALGGDPDAPLEDHPNYQVAQASLDQARIALSHVEVRAPASGIVAKVPNDGEYITKGAITMVLVADQDQWIEANFTEKDLTYVQSGQTVKITVDAYPDVVWKGTVDSLSPATGSEFSVIPAQNATGNWVKIAQRLSIRIHLDANPRAPVLRTGLSSDVTIDTEHHRSVFGIRL